MFQAKRTESETDQANEAIEAEKPARYFQRKIPHAVFDDPRLDLGSFYLLMQRGRHADNFVLNWKHICKQHRFGKDNFYAALPRLKTLEYLSREQRRDEKGFTYCVEELNFAAAPTSVRQKFEILRPNVSGISWQPQALLDYLYSHAPSFPVTAGALASRFGVCERTVRRHLRVLGKEGLVELVIEHDEKGRFAREGYIAVRECSSDGDRPDKNRKQDSHRSDIYRTHLRRTHKNRTHNKDHSCNKDDPCNKDHQRNYPSGTYTDREKTRSAPDDAELRSARRKEDKGPQGEKRAPRSPGRAYILGKNKNDDLLIQAMFRPDGIYDVVNEIDYWITDDDLKKRLLEACHRRIGKALLSTNGIASAKWLVAADTYYRDAPHDDEVDILEAIQSFIEGPLARFSSWEEPDGPWLNSWSLIAIRMAADADNLTGRYADFDPEEAYRKETYDPDGDVPF